MLSTANRTVLSRVHKYNIFYVAIPKYKYMITTTKIYYNISKCHKQCILGAKTLSITLIVL